MSRLKRGDRLLHMACLHLAFRVHASVFQWSPTELSVVLLLLKEGQALEGEVCHDPQQPRTCRTNLRSVWKNWARITKDLLESSPSCRPWHAISSSSWYPGRIFPWPSEPPGGPGTCKSTNKNEIHFPTSYFTRWRWILRWPPSQDASSQEQSGIVLPVSKEVVVIVTTGAQLCATRVLPPNTGGVNNHAEYGRGWQPGWKQENDSWWDFLLIGLLWQSLSTEAQAVV